MDVTGARKFNLSTVDGDCEGEAEAAKAEGELVGLLVDPTVGVIVVGAYVVISVGFIVVGVTVGLTVGFNVG